MLRKRCKTGRENINLDLDYEEPLKTGDVNKGNALPICKKWLCSN